MKKTLVTILLIAAGTLVNAQAPFVQWQRSLGSSTTDWAMCIEGTSDGGHVAICAGSSSDGDFTGSHGQIDIWVVKMSAWGSVLWKKPLGGSSNDYASSIKQTTDGGYIVGGYVESSDGDITVSYGSKDYWVVKLDDTGRIQWQKTFGGTGWDVLNMVQQTTDGGYICIGQTASTDGDITFNHGNEDMWIIKLSAAGSIQWQKTFGGTAEEDGTAIQQTADGGYIAAGNSNSTDGDVTGFHGNIDPWIVKLSSAGVIEWEHCYGGTGRDQNGDHAYAGSIEQTADGGYVFAGFTNSTDGDVTGFHGGTLYDYWVVKLSATGSIQWQKALGGTEDDDAFCVRQTPDGGYIVSGTTASADGDVSGPTAAYDCWIVKLNAAGSIVWEKNYGGSKGEFPYYIRAVTDSEFIACGYSDSNDGDVSGNHGVYDAWIVKLAYCSLPVVNNITGPAIVCTGSAITLSNATPGGTWSASNGNAMVSGGVVTGVYAGNVALLYTVTNTCGAGGATQMVNVAPLPVPVVTQTSNTLSTTSAFVTYQWLKDGSPIAGATNPTYVTTVHDTFTVIVTNANGCSDTSSMYISGLAVPGVNSAGNMHIIPNPVKDIMYIQGMNNASVRVYNTIGQLVKTADSTNAVSLSGLPTGMYVVRVYDEHGLFVQQEKVMKE